MKCRVFFQPDGQVLITHFVWTLKQQNESEREFMDRLSLRLSHKDLPWQDVEAADLPSREVEGIPVREKWRGAPGKGVWIDRTTSSKVDKIRALSQQSDSELAKPSPDAVTVMRLWRDMQKVQNGK